MKGRVLLDEKQDVVLTQNAILFVECPIRARSGYNCQCIRQLLPRKVCLNQKDPSNKAY